MKQILWIWFGENSVPIERQNAIAETMLVYPDAEYVCITKQKSFLDPKIKCIDPQVITDQMVTYFELKETPEVWKEYLIFSDWVRYFYIANNPDTLYLDTDCRALKTFDFSKVEKVLNPKFDIFLLYSPANGIGKEILPILKEQSKKCISLTVFLARTIKPLWAGEMPEGYFKHKG